MTDEGARYVTGWTSQRVHTGGMRGGPPRRTVVPDAPLHAVPVGSDEAACGAYTPYTDDAQPWSSGGMGRCAECRAALG
jgi:hypothetical protein